MISEVDLVDAVPTTLASVHSHVAWTQLSTFVPKLLGEVWDFLKAAPVRPAGHNVVVYRAPGADGVDLEAGVQVSGDFECQGRVGCSKTPAGRAVHVIYTGPYSELGKAHDALVAYCNSHGFPPGIHWEVYGDWEEDPSKLRTDVYRLTSG